LDLAKTEAYFFTIILFVIGLLNVAIIWIGGTKYIAGELSIGKIADFFMYINTLIFHFYGRLGNFRQSEAEASMQRINEFMDKKSEIINTNFETYPIKGDIEFRNVSYVYPNTGIKALDNLSFKIKAGESLAIMGKTGSGKSTIALLLCRLIDPTEGEILIDGKNLKEHNLRTTETSLDIFRRKVICSQILLKIILDLPLIIHHTKSNRVCQDCRCS
jgi:ATP-binding cassette subfamily B protein